MSDIETQAQEHAQWLCQLLLRVEESHRDVMRWLLAEMFKHGAKHAGEKPTVQIGRRGHQWKQELDAALAADERGEGKRMTAQELLEEIKKGVAEMQEQESEVMRLWRLRGKRGEVS